MAGRIIRFIGDGITDGFDDDGQSSCSSKSANEKNPFISRLESDKDVKQQHETLRITIILPICTLYHAHFILPAVSRHQEPEKNLACKTY